MATAVLLPQDCLSSNENKRKSRLLEASSWDGGSQARKGNSRESLSSNNYRVSPATSRGNSSANRSERSVKCTSASMSHVGANSSSSGLNGSFEGKKFKSRKPRMTDKNMDSRLFPDMPNIAVKKFNSKVSSEVPCYRILQRPKDKDAAKELFAQFFSKAECERVSKYECILKVDAAEGQCGANKEPCVSSDDPISQPNVHWKPPEGRVSGYKSKKGTLSMKIQQSLPSNFSDGKLHGLKFKRCNSSLASQEFKILDVDVISSKLDDGESKEKKVQDQQGGAPVSPEPINLTRRGSIGGYEVMNRKGLGQLASMKKASACNNIMEGLSQHVTTKVLHQNNLARLENNGPNCLFKLKRTATDPKIVDESQECSKGGQLNIPFRDVHPNDGLNGSTSMSCPEKWAGSPYYSSPAPSSLPVPKFFLSSRKSYHHLSEDECAQSRSPSPDPVLLAASFYYQEEGYAQSRSSSPDPNFPAPGFCKQEDGLDVASATKSLRRMLKLD
ncbi:hypothetical protein KP509_17G064000 [Ceratopteris richardii]|uniref:Uncharacterized protein n=1 Tax=Ceratopteris richardii TaxID=49495 RepID=A0A8T2SXM0_CERRI|nr:hypothetical protein KP509_17G064000 [Ceratopteris richardii]KAH7373595.1 hypothetical protein KP509_17G064000 [Ceratopteris richardii]KAH7373596.1 hypothetical protein KP509_17G064000 [Ceratopteris richardii]